MEKLNSSPYLLPIKNNNVIDLRDGTIRTRTKHDYFSYELDVQYDNSDTSKAEKFFSELMQKNVEATRYLQTSLGYIITGETASKCLFLFVGEKGDNGKSTLIHILSTIFSQFYKSVSKEVMIDLGGSKRGPSPEIAELQGIRFISYAETNEQEKLNEALLKMLTGNDIIKARPLYQSPIQFRSILKPIILTNKKPLFNTNDNALKNRIHYIPFDAEFKDEPKNGQFKKDEDFVNSLINEHKNQVFTWIVNGAINWYKDKRINVPNCMKEAKEKYINEIDIVQQYIDDRCEVGQDLKEYRTVLFEDFVDWCKQNAEKICKREDFYNNLLQKGYGKSIIKGKRYIKGLKINELEDSDDDL